jgi:zinc/manganese transport system substrate-binding protein
VVATTAYFKNLIEQVGGERVRVYAVASPKFNVHFVQPKPSDVARTAKADLFVFAGLDLEAWADPLLEASGRHDLFRGREKNLDLSEGISMLNIPAVLTRAEGDLHAFGNPHYTLNPENARIMAQTAAAKLRQVDPAHAEEYTAREKEFLAKLDSKIAEWKSLCAHCSGKTVVAYHDDVAYLARFLGLKDGLYIEPKPGVSPSPKHLAELEAAARQSGVRAVLAATYCPKRLISSVAERIQAKPVVILQAPGEIKGTEDLFVFYDYNIRAVAEALHD